jgi:hypothetical protein
VAEVSRLYSCDFLNRLPQTLEQHLASELSETPSDLFYGSLLNTNAKNYGFKASAKFESHLATTIKDQIGPKFDSGNWNYKDGFTRQSVLAVLLLNEQE